MNKRDYLLTQVAIFPCVWFYYLSLNTSSIWQPNYQKQCLVFDKRHFPVFYKQHYPVFNNCLQQLDENKRREEEENKMIEEMLVSKGMSSKQYSYNTESFITIESLLEVSFLWYNFFLSSSHLQSKFVDKICKMIESCQRRERVQRAVSSGK